MIFIYDKKCDLTCVANIKKRKLNMLYIARNNTLFSLDVLKEKSTTKERKVVTSFEEDIKLWFTKIYDYDYILRAVIKSSNRLEFPKQIYRIELDADSNPKLYTVKSSVLDNYKSKF